MLPSHIYNKLTSNNSRLNTILPMLKQRTQLFLLPPLAAILASPPAIQTRTSIPLLCRALDLQMVCPLLASEALVSVKGAVRDLLVMRHKWASREAHKCNNSNYIKLMMVG